MVAALLALCLAHVAPDEPPAIEGRYLGAVVTRDWIDGAWEVEITREGDSYRVRWFAGPDERGRPVVIWEEVGEVQGGVLEARFLASIERYEIRGGLLCSDRWILVPEGR